MYVFRHLAEDVGAIPSACGQFHRMLAYLIDRDLHIAVGFHQQAVSFQLFELLQIQRTPMAKALSSTAMANAFLLAASSVSPVPCDTR